MFSLKYEMNYYTLLVIGIQDFEEITQALDHCSRTYPSCHHSEINMSTLYRQFLFR
jgi:hypothetical protein